MTSAAAPPPVSEAVQTALLSSAFRLPTHVLPQHYALEFQPNTLRDTFEGCAYVTLRVVAAPPAPVHHLVLHALDLRIAAAAVRVFVPADPAAALSDAATPPAHPSQHHDDAEARCRPFPTDGGGVYIACTRILTFEASETALLLFDAALPSAVGDSVVLIVDRFVGVIARPPNMEGLYHSNSTDDAALSTHLEPTGARRLYPCFDEPAIQSTFQLSVVAAAAHTVLSNTEVEAEVAVAAPPHDAAAPSSPSSPSSSSSSWRCVRFQCTPLLHTCIVGFHVGRFTLLEQRSRRSRVLCRVVLPHTEGSSGGWFALDLAAKAVDFFEEFFDVRLPLTKLDVVGVETFCVLGMENWGMINLDKQYLVVTDATPLERRQRITRLIGHEICHQWFGNRVSIEWWSCLWLKEGMCRYLEYFFVNAVFPSWGLWNEFVCKIMNGALLADADPRETHPVECCNPAPRRIFDSFDNISYGKGACVLRMLFSVIGVAWLKRATHILMVRFAGRAVNAKDLGDCIVDTAEEYGSGDTQAQHAKAIRSCLRMVETVSHPYLYIQQRPGGSCTITQYVVPSTRHGLLAHYLQQQRGAANAPVIDLFTAPARATFEWTPETTLDRVATPFTVPLRSVQWRPSGQGDVQLIFLEEVEHHFAFPVPAPASDTALSPLSTAARRRSTVGSVSSSSGGGACDSGGVDAAPETPLSLPAPAPAGSPALGGAQGLCYFNKGGGGFFRCDYDAATWRCLFHHVAVFSEEDRMIITMHFIDSAKAQLGRQPGDAGDRCTLFFEWLLRLTGTAGAMNSFLWEVVTDALTTIVQLVQQYYCHSIVKEFVNSLYTPLQRRCVLSFFAQEKTVSFQSSLHLSRQLVLRILQLLCLCDNPAVTEEAVETAQWTFAALLAPGDLLDIGGNAAGGGGGGGGTSGVTNLSIASVSGGFALAAGGGGGGSGVNVGSPLSADIPVGRSTGAPAVSTPTTSTPIAVPLPTRRDSVQQAGNVAHSHSRGSIAFASSSMKVARMGSTSMLGHAASSAPRPGALLSSTPAGEHGSSGNLFASSFSNAASSAAHERSVGKSASLRSYACQRAGDFNVEDQSHTMAGAIALSHLVTQGRLEFWVAAAAVAAELLRLDRDEVQRIAGLPAPQPRLAHLRPAQRRSLLRLVLPPVFALDREAAFPFMARVFLASPCIEATTVTGLYRNSRFLVHLLSTRRVATERRTLDFLLRCGADVCGNGYVIAQLKLLVQGGAARFSAAGATGVEEFRGVEFGDSPPVAHAALSASCSSTDGVVGVERHALRKSCPAAAAALDSMEANCVWMDYCCSYYDQFLREQLQRKAWQQTRNSDTASAQLSTSLAEESHTQSETFGGVSI